MNNDKLVLTVNEVAELLGMSRNSIYNGIRRGEIPHIRIGKLVLIPHVALNDMLNKASEKRSGQGLPGGQRA